MAIDFEVIVPELKRQGDAFLGAELYTLRSQHGHDGFLIETDQLEERVRIFRDNVESRKFVDSCVGGAA